MSHRIIYDVSEHLINWVWLMPGILGLVIGLGWLRIIQADIPTWRATKVARRRASLLCAASLVWMALTYTVFMYPYLRYTLMLIRGTYQVVNAPVRYDAAAWLTEFESSGRFMIGDVDFTYHCTSPLVIIPIDCFADPNVDTVRTGLIKKDLAVRVLYVIEATGTPMILRIEDAGLP